MEDEIAISASISASHGHEIVLVREPFELKAHAVSCPKCLGADSGAL